jgi:GAF domain-containing protein/CheY-like chemotaxis protein/anti-sigma regulatory factor (Ser/Thr protein kinase)
VRKRSSRPAERTSGVRAEKLQALTELTRRLTSMSESVRLFAEVARAAATLLDAAAARVWIDDPLHQVLRLQGSFGIDRSGGDAPVEHIAIPYGSGLVGRIFESREPAYIEDIAEDPRLLNRGLMTESGLHGFAGWPLLAAGRVVGVLVVLTQPRRLFTDEEQRLLGLLTGQAAIAITNAVHLEEAERRRRAAESLAELGRAIAQSLDLADIGRRIVEALRPLFGAQNAGLFRRDAYSGALIAVAISTGVDGRVERDATSEAMVRVVDEAATSRQPVQSGEKAGDAVAGWSALAVPLLVQDLGVGALAVFGDAGRHFEAEEIALMQAFADQATHALENARLYADTTQRRHEAEELARVAALLTESLDVASVTERVVESVLSLFGANSSALYLLEADGSARALAWGGQGLSHFERNQRFPPGAGVIGRALISGAPVWSKDILEDDVLPVPADMRRRIMAAGNRAVLAVPMRAKGRIIGGLSIAHDTPRDFAGPTIALLQTFADQAALALENARLYDETERRRREAEELGRFARVLTETLDLKALGTRIVESALLLFDAYASDLRMVESDGSLMEVTCAGALRDRFEPGHRTPPGVGISGLTARLGRAVATENILADSAILLDDDLRARIADLGARGALAAPLRAKGKVLAVLSVAAVGPRAFSPAEVLLLETFADHAAVAIQNAQLYEEAQRAYDELSRAQAQLVRSETLRAIGEVASGAAHHLNNLLGIIAGRTELLLRRLATTDHRRSLETVNRAALDAAEVVRRIRSFSRAHTTPLLESLDLNELVHEIVELTRPRWFDQSQKQGVRISVTAEPGDIPPIAGEAAALREVLMNLVLNAVDALPAGGSVKLRTWCDAHGVSCAVSDTGTGMSPEVQRRALEPFFTTKGPKSTGLGLSVNYGIIGAHGGTMAIESASGCGTTVTFTVPAASALEAARSAAPLAIPPTPRRILLIDDDAPIREVIADILREDGHQVEEAGHGRDGLARMRDGVAFDLVITDLGMPEVTGWDIIRAAKSQQPPMPIGLVTGWGDDPDGRPADCARPDFVLAKPVTHAALRLALGRVAALFVK